VGLQKLVVALLWLFCTTLAGGSINEWMMGELTCFLEPELLVLLDGPVEMNGESMANTYLGTSSGVAVRTVV